MSIPYEKAVAEDLNVGLGAVSVTMPAGGSASGSKIGLHTFSGIYNVQNCGAAGDGTTDDTAAWQAAHDALPTDGGIIQAQAGSYIVSSTLSLTKPVRILGAGAGVTSLTLNRTASALHLFSTTKSLHLSDISLTVATPPTTALVMKAINLDNPATTGHAVTLERVKIRGFNIGVFVDGRTAGGQSTNVDRVTIRDCDIQISGAASSVAGCLDVHGCTLVEIVGNLLDQNSKGDHAVYLIRNTSVRVENNRIKNTTGNSACGVKLVTELVADSGTLDTWSVSGNEIVNTSLPILVSLTGSLTLDRFDLTRNTIRTATSTLAGDEAAIRVVLSTTATLRHASVVDLYLEDVQQHGMIFSLAAGATLQTLRVIAVTVKNFGQLGAATYRALSTSGGTRQHLTIMGLLADGNAVGRSALDAVGWTTAQSLNVREMNCTGPASVGLVGFLGATPVAAQTSAAFTNNITAGGTDDSVTNYTDLVTYANDALTLRRNIYQLARTVKQLSDALRAFGLLT